MDRTLAAAQNVRKIQDSYTKLANLRRDLFDFGALGLKTGRISANIRATQSLIDKLSAKKFKKSNLKIIGSYTFISRYPTDAKQKKKDHTWPTVILSAPMNVYSNNEWEYRSYEETVQLLNDKMQALLEYLDFSSTDDYEDGEVTFIMENSFGTLRAIAQGQDKAHRTLVRDIDGNPWNSVSYREDYVFDNPSMIINASEAPLIEGLRSCNGRFGCYVQAIAWILRKSPLEVRDQIAEIIGGLKLSDGVRDDEAADEIIIEDKIIGISNEQFVTICEKLLKSRQWYIHVGFNTIAGPAPNTKSNKVVHFTLINNHVYIGKINLMHDISTKKLIVVDEFDVNTDLTDTLFLIEDPLGESTLNDVVIQIQKTHNTIPACKIVDGHIVAVQYKSNVIMDSMNFNERKQIYNSIQQRFPNDPLFMKSFMKQSWVTISRYEMLAMNLELFKSFDSPADYDFNKVHHARSFVGSIDPADRLKSEYNDLHEIDFKKNFAKIVIEHEDSIVPIFGADDHWNMMKGLHPLEPAALKPFEEGFAGMVLLDSFKYHGVTIPSQIWSGYWVQQLIELGVDIKRKHILAYRFASNFTTMNNLSTYMKHCIDTHGDNAKHMYTRLIGSLGTVVEAKYKSFITTDMDYAMMQNDCELSWIGDNIFTVSKRSDTKIFDNYRPYWTHITNGSVVKLLSMVKVVRDVAPEITILTGRVDGLYVKGLTESHHIAIMDTMNKKWSVNGQSFDTITISTTSNVNLILNETKESKPTIPHVYHNKIIFGKPGVGKSRSITQILKDNLDKKTLVTSMTHSTVQGFDKSIIESGHTNIVKETLSRLAAIYTAGSLNHKYDLIIVDEMSCLSDRLLKGIFALMNNNPSVEVVLIGDMNQLPSPCVPLIDIDSTMMKLMFPLRIHLQYVFEGELAGRMDRQLHDASDYLLTHHKLPEILLDNVIDIDNALTEASSSNVCKYNKTRHLVNNSQIETHKYFDVIADKPWICKQNDLKRGHINNKLYTDQEVKDLKIPAQHLEPSYTRTSYIIQGDTIEENLVIYDIAKMSLRDIYVAITRVHHTNQLVFVGDKKQISELVFKDTVPVKSCKEVVPKFVPHVVYLIEDPTNKSWYVGKTKASSLNNDDIQSAITKRFNQHIYADMRAQLEQEDIDELDNECESGRFDMDLVNGKYVRVAALKNLSLDATITSLMVLTSDINGHRIKSAEKYWTKEMLRRSSVVEDKYYGYKTLNIQNIKDKPVRKAAEYDMGGNDEEIIIDYDSTLFQKLSISDPKIMNNHIIWRYTDVHVDKKVKFKVGKNTLESVSEKLIAWILSDGRKESPILNNKLINIKL